MPVSLQPVLSAFDLYLCKNSDCRKHQKLFSKTSALTIGQGAGKFCSRIEILTPTKLVFDISKEREHWKLTISSQLEAGTTLWSRQLCWPGPETVFWCWNGTINPVGLCVPKRLPSPGSSMTSTRRGTRFSSSRRHTANWRPTCEREGWSTLTLNSLRGWCSRMAAQPFCRAISKPALPSLIG